jgi:hypothetical protein
MLQHREAVPTGLLYSLNKQEVCLRRDVSIVHLFGRKGLSVQQWDNNRNSKKKCSTFSTRD